MVKKEKGMVLVVVVVVVLILVITGMALLTLAEQESILGRIDTDKTRAFYLAEAGLAKLQEQLQTYAGGAPPCLIEDTLEQGRFSVVLDANHTPCYAVSTGISGTIQKKVRVQANFLAVPFEDAIYARNSGGGKWAFDLRGKGNPIANKNGENGGKDIINGNVLVNGDVILREQSGVNASPAPNKWSLNGDVEATGSISLYDTAQVSGQKSPGAKAPDLVDMASMDYERINTHNVGQIFQQYSVNSGTLPPSNELHNVFAMNPSNRSKECATTTGNDYFLEPVNVPSSGGTQKDAPTPLHLGNDRIYYVDGDLWIHNNTTYGFTVDGKVTIVATGNIHICDNIKYANADSALGLVALGTYDNSGNLVSGGNIYFGDPRFGTMYVFSGMLFAANNFYYNNDSVTNKPAEPTTGFTVNGSYAAMNKVQIERDWYTLITGQGNQTEARPAHYNSATGQWVDSQTGGALTSTQISSIRHYQMIVNYDERVRNPETQPPGLPRGGAHIFAGFSKWEEL